MSGCPGDNVFKKLDYLYEKIKAIENKQVNVDLSQLDPRFKKIEDLIRGVSVAPPDLSGINKQLTSIKTALDVFDTKHLEEMIRDLNTKIPHMKKLFQIMEVEYKILKMLGMSIGCEIKILDVNGNPVDLEDINWWDDLRKEGNQTEGLQVKQAGK